MPYSAPFEKYFQQALTAFPYPCLQSTGIMIGDMAPGKKRAKIEYAEEFAFTAGQFLGDELIGGGYIELRHEAGDTGLPFLG